MKKIFTLLFALIVSAEMTFAETYSGTCGGNLTWTLTTEDGVLAIDGTGNMNNYTKSGTTTPPWYEYRSSITSITIGNSVTSIGKAAFTGCTNLTSVEIPNSVTTIRALAFNGCSGLISVTIGESVTEIVEFAFYGCTHLKSIIWNAKNCNNFSDSNTPFHYSGDYEDLSYYGTNVYSLVKQITSFTFGDNVESIPAYLCSELNKLTSVTIPNSVTSIGKNAFSGCSGLTSITCKAVNPPSLGNSVFYNVDKTYILYVPAESIGAYKAADQWKEFKNILPINSCTTETFVITFVNYDGSELQSRLVEADAMPSYTGTTPVKPAEGQYNYVFTGWTPEIVAVSGDATYMATFESVLRTCSIIWQDEKGNIIKTDEVAYGEIPNYIGETPTKAATTEYTYEFAGWLPAIQAATENVRYTTFFERNKIETPKYNVNINGENCSLHISNEVPTGTTLQVEAVADECFQFQKWSDNETANPRTINVTEDANLTAEFNKLQYTITGKSENVGGQVQVQSKGNQ